MPIRVTVWNENRHEQTDERVRAIYPRGIHGTIADALSAHSPDSDLVVRTATLDEPEQGLSGLDDTDVLLFWGHRAHHEVRDDLVERIVARVHEGMGFIALHSSHFSKPFTRLMGTSCRLQWRVPGGRERLWVVEPKHPIAAGIPQRIEIDEEEMYGEPFDVPRPDEIVFISSFSEGEVFRSGCCYRRGSGRIFYFRPGHETYRAYHHPLVQRVLVNATRWAAGVR